MLNLKNIKKLFIRGAVITAMLTTAANAAWVPDLNVKTISAHPNGDIDIKFDKTPENTCNSWGFDFLVKNDNGNVLKILTIAKILNKKVDIVYEPTTTPDAINNDCKVAIIYKVTLK